MPVMTYCWRCQRDIPMLTDAENRLLHEEAAMIHRRRQEWWNPLWWIRKMRNKKKRPPWEEPSQAFFDVYEEFVGYRDENWCSISHHLVSLYGPPCPVCRKPLRTPKASFCAACGTPRTLDQAAGARQ